MKIVKLFYFIALFAFLSSCDEEEARPTYFTLTLDGVELDYSANLDFFFNAGGTYTIKGQLDDTTSLSIVIPTLSAETYTKESNGDEARIGLNIIDYDSDNGIDSDYEIIIEEASESYISGQFSGNLGSILTSIGFESDYKKVTNGSFAISKE